MITYVPVLHHCKKLMYVASASICAASLGVIGNSPYTYLRPQEKIYKDRYTKYYKSTYKEGVEPPFYMILSHS